MNLKTEANTKLFFPSFLSTKTPLCTISLFTRKIQVWSASPGCTSTPFHLPDKNGQRGELFKQMITKKRFEIVPAAGARSKLIEIVPSAIFF